MDEIERAILALLASHPSTPPTAERIARRPTQPADEVEGALAAPRVMRYVSAVRVSHPAGAAAPASAITPTGRDILAAHYTGETAARARMPALRDHGIGTPAMQPHPTDRPAPARVLVVDDDPALLLTLARVLASEGFRVDVARDGADGLARARAQPPTVVLLDLHMPVLDGYAFLEGFRALPACAAVPVILMTGSEDTASARRRITAPGVVVLIPKPFDLATLLATVRGAARAAASGAAGRP